LRTTKARTIKINEIASRAYLLVVVRPRWHKIACLLGYPKEKLPKIKANFEAIVGLLNEVRMKNQTADEMLATDDAKLGLKALLDELYGSSDK